MDDSKSFSIWLLLAILFARCSMSLPVRSAPAKIDGVQKFVDVIVVLELKLVLHLVYDYLQAVGCIPVSREKLIGVVKTWIFFGEGNPCIAVCHVYSPFSAEGSATAGIFWADSSPWTYGQLKPISGISVGTDNI